MDTNDDLLKPVPATPKTVPLPGVTARDIEAMDSTRPEPPPPLPPRPAVNEGVKPSVLMRRDENGAEDLADAYWRIAYNAVDGNSGNIIVTDAERDNYWRAMLQGTPFHVTVPDNQGKFCFRVRDLTTAEIDLALRCYHLDEKDGLVDQSTIGFLTTIRFYHLAMAIESTGIGDEWAPFKPDPAVPREKNATALRAFVNAHVKSMQGLRWNLFLMATEVASIKFKMLADSARAGFFSGASGTA